MASNVLLWFKNDLRINDNWSLVNACNSGKSVLPIIIIDPRHYQKLPLNFPKADQVRFRFLSEAILDLRKNLVGIGGNLMIRTGLPEQIIPELVGQFKIDTIYTEQEYATEELAQLKSVRNSIPESCNLDLTWGRTLYHLKDIPYTPATIPLTSKVYRIKTTKESVVRSTIPAPSQMDSITLTKEEWGMLSNENEVGLTSEKNFSLTYMPGGETKALERLNHYLFDSEQLTNYRWTRNRSLGLDYSSKLSPYLALGCISPRTIYEAVKQYEKTIKKNQSTWWIIFEIIWRDYFTFKLMRFQNKIYSSEGYTSKERVFTNSKQLFECWCKGRTGIPFVDAHMRQLRETGFMSNRGRVNCSSFLVHDYQVDWTWGAAYFESKLIDYDVGSNWMNWHTQAFQIWYTNPVHQSNKYKAQNFIRKWIPEIAHLDDTQILIPWEQIGLEYDKPVEIYAKWNRSINKIKKEGME